MAVLKCKRCDGELRRHKDRAFKCLFCGTVQTFGDLPIDFKYEEIEMSPAAQYEYACELMVENNIYFLQQAADIFGSLPDFLDAKNKQEECLNAIRKQQAQIDQKNAEIQRKAEKAQRKKAAKSWAIAIFVIVVVALIVVIPKVMHDEKAIQLGIVDVWGQSDEKYHYVYMDYRIENNTGSTIDCIKVTTYFSDKFGKNLGTATSSFGSQYGDTALNLKPNETVIRETYLSEYKGSNVYDFFAMLYENGTEDLIITYEITYVEWCDGHTYSR